MAMDGIELADIIVDKLTPADMDASSKETMKNAWIKICTSIIDYIHTNAEWSIEYRKVVSVTEDSLGVHTVKIEDPIFIPPTEFVPNPVQPVSNISITQGMGIL